MALLMWTVPASALATAYVQQNGAVSATSAFPVTSVNLSITNPPAVGNTIIISYAGDSSSGTGSLTCSDDQGNSYNTDVVHIYNGLPPNYPVAALCSAQIGAGKIPTTITLTHNNAYNRVAMVHEYSGLLAAPAVDRISSDGGNSASPSSGATATTTQADELVVGVVSAADGNTSIFNSDSNFPGGPFQFSQSGGTYPRALQSQYRIVSATGTYTYAPTLTASRRWAAAVATYKATAVSTIDISGSCKQSDQVTDCTDTGTLRVAVNGTLQGQTQPTVAGTWTISGVTQPSSGDVITVYIAGAADANEAVAVTKYDGSGNITGIELFERNVTLGSDDNQTIANADLAQYDYSVSGNNEDILHDVDGANDLTISVKLSVKSGNIFRPDAASSGDVSVSDLENNGTITADGNTFNLTGTFDDNGVFNAGTSTISIVAALSGSYLYPGASSYYNVTVNSNEVFYNLGGDITVTNNFITQTSTPAGFGTFTIGANTITTKNFSWPSGYLSVSAHTIDVSGDFTNSGGSYFGGAGSTTIQFTGSGNSTFTPGTVTHGNVTVNKSSQTDAVTVATHALNMAGSTTLNIQSGILDIAGNNFNVGAGSTVSNTGTLRLQGGETVSNFTNDVDSGTVLYNGAAGPYGGLAAGDAYHHLTFNGAGSWTLDAALDVEGDIDIAAGTLNAGGFDINVAGHWSKNGAFNHGDGSQTVVLDGGDQSISGSTTFNHFTKTEATDNATDVTLTFENSVAQIIEGTLTLDGLDGDDRINLVSDSPGTQWGLTLAATATKAIDFVDVTDSDASSSDGALLPVNPTNTVDGGNNVDWFAVPAIDISGSCKQVDRVTNCTDTGTIRVAVNGALQAQTQATVAGSWTLSSVTQPSSGDVITVYIEGAADASEVVAVTQYDGTGNITGIELIEQHLSIGSDDNQTLTNADLGQYDNSVSGSEDVFHEVDAGNHLTVDITTALTDETLYIKTGNIFQPDSSGGKTVATHDVNINGTFIADGNNVTVAGSWDNNGVFTANTSTVNFTAASGTELVDSSGATTDDFYDITFDDGGGSATFQLASALDVGHDLTVTDGILDTASGSNHAINVVNHLNQSGGHIAAYASTLTVGGDFTATGLEDSTSLNGADLILTGTGLLQYNNLDFAWFNGVNNLTVGQSGNVTTLIHRMTVLTTMTIGSGTLTGTPELFLAGENPLSVDPDSTVSVSMLTFYRNATAQNLIALANGYDCDISVSRSGGILNQLEDIVINGTHQLLVDGDGFDWRTVTYNTNGHALTVGGNIVVGVGGDTGLKTFDGTNSTITVGGDFFVADVGVGTQQAVFIATGSTVILNGSADQTVTSSGSDFNHLTLNNTGTAGNDDIIIASDLDVNGVLTMTDGDFDLGTHDPAVNTAGNVAIGANGSVDVTGRAAVWTFDGATLLTDASSGGPQDLEDAAINGGTLTLGGSTKVQTMTVNSGTLNLGNGGYTLEIDGTGTPLSNSGTFTAGNAIVKYTGTTTATTIATVPYHSLHLAPTAATTYSLTGHLTGANALTGNIIIDSGATLDVTVADYDIAVAGDWTNAGSFTARTGTVTLTGTGQTIMGDTTFYDLTKSVATADTLTFQAGQATSIASGGTLTLSGASGNLLNLRSDSPGTQWNLNVSGSSMVSYVDVDDSNASGGNTIVAYYSTDDTAPSNNDNWVFQSLQLVKQVWTEDGSTCLASVPADAGCNGGVTSITVPINTTVYFLIFVRNVMPAAVTDMRFQDLINDTAFTYQPGTLQRSANDGTAPADNASISTLMASATIAQSDAYDGDTQVDEFAGVNTAASPDDLQVGGGGGAGQNDTLSVPANKTFALRFKARRN